MNILNILLMAPQAGGAQGGGGGIQTFLFIGGMILIMYFFMIRPQTKKAKQQKQFIDNIKEGDRIVTIAGIHGKIKKMTPGETTLVIEVSPGTNFTIERSAISLEYTAALNKPAAEVK